MTVAAADEPTDDLTRCIRCGYDLRGQDDETGRCPECGLKAYWSLRAPQKLSQYPPAWVRRMARATWLLLVAYGGMFTVLLVFSALPDLADEEALLVAFAAASGLQLVGMWMLSSWSGRTIERPARVNRWALRVAPIGLVAVAAFAAGHELGYARLPDAVAVVGFVVGAMAPTAIFIRLRAVARLIGDAGLAEHSAIVGWGFLATVALLVATVAYGETTPYAMGGTTGLILMLLVGVGTLLFLLWGAFIFFSCAIDFRRAAKIAWAAWTMEGDEDGGQGGRHG